MNRNEKIKVVSQAIYDDYIEKGWKNVSIYDCEVKAIHYVDTEIIVKKLTLTDVVNCNCDESKQLEEEFEINHLINDTYQVVGKDSSTVWKQGTMEECNDWVML